MRKDNYEYIALYNNQSNENSNSNNKRRNIIDMNINSGNIRLPQINIANTEDKLNEYKQTRNLYVNRVNADENDNDKSENIIVRDISINDYYIKEK